MDVAHHCAATATTTTAANGPFLLHGCSHSNKYQYQHRETQLRVLKLNDDGRKATQKEWTKQRVRLLFFCYSQCYRCCWCCCCLPLFFRYIRMIRNTCVYSSISFWFVHVSHAMQCHLLVFFGWCCLRFLMLLEFFVRLLNLLLFLLVVHVTMHWAMPAIRIFWRMWMYSWCIFFYMYIYFEKSLCYCWKPDIAIGAIMVTTHISLSLQHPLHQQQPHMLFLFSFVFSFCTIFIYNNDSWAGPYSNSWTLCTSMPLYGKCHFGERRHDFYGIHLGMIIIRI